jgi:hypothetical protein
MKTFRRRRQSRARRVAEQVMVRALTALWLVRFLARGARS